MLIGFSAIGMSKNRAFLGCMVRYSTTVISVYGVLNFCSSSNNVLLFCFSRAKCGCARVVDPSFWKVIVIFLNRSKWLLHWQLDSEMLECCIETLCHNCQFLIHWSICLSRRPLSFVSRFERRHRCWYCFVFPSHTIPISVTIKRVWSGGILIRTSTEAVDDRRGF